MTFHVAALNHKIRAIGAEWPPSLRAMALAALHIAVFMAICSISYLRLPMGSTIAGGLLGLLALASPLSGLLFILIAVNFEYLFWFDPSALYRIGLLLSVAYLLRSLPITLPEVRRLSPLWIVLVAFIGVLVLHLYPEVGFGKSFEAIGFCVLAAAIFLHSRHAAGTPDAATIVTTICVSGVVACIFSFAYLYLPAPELFLSHSPLYDLRINDLHLSGAQDSPNAMAKLLVPGIIALMVLALAASMASGIWLVFFVACTVLVAATTSKSTLLALFAVGLMFSLVAAKRHLLIAWSIALIGAFVVALLFTGAVLPILKVHVAEAWQKYSEPQLQPAYYATEAKLPFLTSLRLELRIPVAPATPAVEGEEGPGNPQFARPAVAALLAPERNRTIAKGPEDKASVAPRPVLGMPSLKVLVSDQESRDVAAADQPVAVPSNADSVPDQKSQFIARPKDGNLAATSQRLWVFEAGLEIISLHPFWGIGYKQWPAAMQPVTGVPFVSPHNGLLELWGSYGVLGGLLYLALIAIAVRNYMVIRKYATDPVSLWLNLGIGLFLLAVLLHEMVEVATVLAVTPYALWGWTALGLQDGMVRQYKPKTI